MIRRFNLRYLVLIRGSDLLLVLGALALATWLRKNVELGAFGADDAFGTPPIVYLVVGALWQVSFQLLSVYTPIYSAWFWRELQRIMIAHTLACLLFFGVLYLTVREYSRLQSIYFIILSLLLIVLFRLILRIYNKVTHRSIGLPHVAVVVGTDANAERVGKTISMYTWTGLTLLGYVKHHADDEVFKDINGQVIGIIDDLPALITKHGVREVVIALKSPEPAYISRVIEMLQYCVINIRLAPDYSELAYFHVSTENFGGLPLIGLREAVLSPSQRLGKRIFDVSVALLAFIFGWPIFLAVMVAIRMDSPGPVLFSQKRIGQHGRIFTMYKFRSMYIDADKMEVPDPVNHKSKDDPRITRVGRFIRRTSLDEIPQFYNILRGDMSFVGPRPEMPWLVDKYENWQRKRFEVPQGLTGWWQVTGRADKPMYLNTEDDLFYIRNYSLWLDLQIVARTILIVLTGRGAF